MSIDPLAEKYPFYTPFQYAGNQPVNMIDIDGLEGTAGGAGGSEKTPLPNIPIQNGRDRLDALNTDSNLVAWRSSIEAGKQKEAKALATANIANGVWFLNDVPRKVQYQRDESTGIIEGAKDFGKGVLKLSVAGPFMAGYEAIEARSFDPLLQFATDRVMMPIDAQLRGFKVLATLKNGDEHDIAKMFTMEGLGLATALLGGEFGSKGGKQNPGGRRINIYGEGEIGYENFENFATDPANAKFEFNSRTGEPGYTRPLTTELPNGSASEIAINNCPIDDFTHSEIDRISRSGTKLYAEHPTESPSIGSLQSRFLNKGTIITDQFYEGVAGCPETMMRRFIMKFH